MHQQPMAPAWQWRLHPVDRPGRLRGRGVAHLHATRPITIGPRTYHPGPHQLALCGLLGADTVPAGDRDPRCPVCIRTGARHGIHWPTNRGRS